MDDKRVKTGAYKEVAFRVNEWLELHYGETFDLDIVCRQCEISSSVARNYVSIELSNKVRQSILEKEGRGGGRTYRFVNKTIIPVNWHLADGATVDLRFPKGEDGSSLNWSQTIQVYPRDLLVFAGESNKGKTVLALNMVFENMDTWKIRLMGNEYDDRKFAARMKNVDWVSPLNEIKQPKFETIRVTEHHKDYIIPDGLNVIDWLNLGDNFYQVSKIMEGIQDKLTTGVAIICLQKTEGKDLGRGGSFSEDLASIYLSISSGIIYTRKIKAWDGKSNPNNRYYNFELIKNGNRFNRIREVNLCKTCKGKGFYFNGGQCQHCGGEGFTLIRGC